MMTRNCWIFSDRIDHFGLVRSIIAQIWFESPLSSSFFFKDHHNGSVLPAQNVQALRHSTWKCIIIRAVWLGSNKSYEFPQFSDAHNTSKALVLLNVEHAAQKEAHWPKSVSSYSKNLRKWCIRPRINSSSDLKRFETCIWRPRYLQPQLGYVGVLLFQSFD